MDTNPDIWAASITKSVFATYVVEHGEISLDVPGARQLQRTRNPRMPPAHPAGFVNFANLKPDKKLHPHFEPGTAYRYSAKGSISFSFWWNVRRGGRWIR